MDLSAYCQPTIYQQTGATEYEVTFRIKYTSRLGENVFVLGDIPQLGTTSDLTKHPLKWTEGHIWVSTVPLRTTTPVFRYHYI